MPPVVDLMARHDLSDRTALQVNVDNLLDKTCHTAIAGPGHGSFIGAGRSVTLSLRHRL